MKTRALYWMLGVGVFVVFGLTILTRGQNRTPMHFSGLINDYTPETINGKQAGPWEMHGTWSLDLKGRSGFADFSAAMTMEHSDYAVVDGVDKADDPSNPDARAAHTHHISMKDARVSDATGTCPTYAAPAPTNPGFVVTGSAYITGNGGPAPFSKGDTVLSTLQVCVNGGTDVPFSNVTLVFGSPANTHFGSQAIHGVVRKVADERRDDENPMTR